MSLSFFLRHLIQLYGQVKEILPQKPENFHMVQIGDFTFHILPQGAHVMYIQSAHQRRVFFDFYQQAQLVILPFASDLIE